MINEFKAASLEQQTLEEEDDDDDYQDCNDQTA